jgi:hypothetical protein
MNRLPGSGGVVLVLLIVSGLVAVLAFLPEIERWIGDNGSNTSNPMRPARSN